MIFKELLQMIELTLIVESVSDLVSHDDTNGAVVQVPKVEKMVQLTLSLQ